jgi:hypothetical protein
MWASRRLHAALEHQQHTEDAPFTAAMEVLLQHQAQVARRWGRCCTAAARCWHAAASAERQHLVESIQSSHYHAGEVLSRHEAPPSKARAALSLPGIIQELRQLQDEFEQVVIDRQNGTIAVVTEPITLQGIRLGPFRLELSIERLRDRQDVAVVACVALDPNPASSSEDTTHPHVQFNTLCAGEAAMPLQAALRDGRICDAMMLINSVLHTYNDGSPYVSLDDWNGISCPDCGYTTDEESLYGCEGCGNRYCESCIGTCDGCDSSYCFACLERMEAGDRQYLCPGCRAICPQCDRVAPAAEVEELGVCRICHDEQEEQRELEPQEQEDHERDDDDNDSADDGRSTAAGETITAGSGSEAAEDEEATDGGRLEASAA